MNTDLYMANKLALYDVQDTILYEVDGILRECTITNIIEDHNAVTYHLREGDGTEHMITIDDETGGSDES